MCPKFQVVKVSQGKPTTSSNCELLLSNFFSDRDPSYASPEMFDYDTDATNISFSTDIWSLSASLFHLASGQLPFHGSTLALARKNIVDRQQIAPDVRELAPKQIQDNISLQFAAIIAKGLEKSPEKRFKSARDMASALHECLVKQSQAIYSIYITYGGPSEKICAVLLHYLLNCKITDKGTRVFVCMRPFLLDNREQWKGLSQGLLKSLVAAPILSNNMIKSLEQLKGNEDDYLDRTLQELVLNERSLLRSFGGPGAPV